MTASTEIKAQAIAFCASGYSCGNIDRQLPSMFSGAEVLRYWTISRWSYPVHFGRQKGTRQRGVTPLRSAIQTTLSP